MKLFSQGTASSCVLPVLTGSSTYHIEFSAEEASPMNEPFKSRDTILIAWESLALSTAVAYNRCSNLSDEYVNIVLNKNEVQFYVL